MVCTLRAWLQRFAFAAQLRGGSCLCASPGLKVRNSSTKTAPHIPGMEYQVGCLTVGGLIPPLSPLLTR